MFRAKATSSLENAITLLNCRRLPARLNTSETAVLLGVQEHDITPLVAAKLLTPLGKPAANAPKYFASVEIVARMESSSWLSDATRTLAKHWVNKNRRKRQGSRIPAQV
jgi:hypothetical protein